MAIINGESVLVPIGDISPHPRNARQGDLGAIIESIRANGFYGHCVVQRSTGHILVGNHRWMAAAEAGLTEVPVTYVEVDDDRALRILLADNRTNDLSAYNDSDLAEILTGLTATDLGLEGTGFDGDALDDLLRDLEPSAEEYPSGDEIDADGLLAEGAVQCPRCKFEFEK